MAIKSQLAANSLFAPSRAAAQRIMENKPILHYETDDMSRIRDYCSREHGIDNKQFEKLKDAYEFIAEIKRKLGI